MVKKAWCHTVVRAPVFDWLLACAHTSACMVQEEIAKRAARAQKFGLPEERQAPSYAPDPEDLKREARAKKFGVKYEKPTPDTLLQKQGASGLRVSKHCTCVSDKEVDWGMLWQSGSVGNGQLCAAGCSYV
jgi:hypothetical protein